MDISPIITLDLTDTTKVKQLQAKAKQYRHRLEHPAPYKAPEHYIGTRYRLRILEDLLRDGQVITWQLSRQLAKEGPVYSDKFDNACGVIQDYVETGGVNNKGGSLPVV